MAGDVETGVSQIPASTLMTLYHIHDRATPIGDVLDRAGSDGVLLEAQDTVSHALLPLDDDLIDYLLERSPAFIAECRAIRERMRAGEVVSHDEVRRILAGR